MHERTSKDAGENRPRGEVAAFSDDERARDGKIVKGGAQGCEIAPQGEKVDIRPWEMEHVLRGEVFAQGNVVFLSDGGLADGDQRCCERTLRNITHRLAPLHPLLVEGG